METSHKQAVETLVAEVAEKTSDYNNVKANLDDLQNQFTDLQSINSDLIVDIKQREEALAEQLKAITAARDKLKSQLKHLQEDHSTLKASLKTEKASLKKEIRARERTEKKSNMLGLENSELKVKNETLSTSLAEVSHTSNELGESLALTRAELNNVRAQSIALNALLEKNEEALKESQFRIRDYDALVTSLEQEKETLFNSTSWKLTRGFRESARALTTIKNKMTVNRAVKEEPLRITQIDDDIVSQDLPGITATYGFPSDIMMNIDNLLQKGGVLHAWGWLFHKSKLIEKADIVVQSESNEITAIPITVGNTRDDVSDTYNFANARQSGFTVFGGGAGKRSKIFGYVFS